MSMREPFFKVLPRPEPMPLAGRRVLVLGLGDSGLSAAAWATRSGARLRIADTRPAPPHVDTLAHQLPMADVRLGPFEPTLLEGIDLVCVSPGLTLDQPVVREAVARGVPVLGDIELFAWGLRAVPGARVIAITGTNGKTTVTALTGHLLKTAGIDSEVAGNISPAALDALLRREGHPPAVWVLELSSYQLESTWSLAPDAAAMLNLSEDHLDRYASLADYGAAKARVFEGARVQIVNRADPAARAMLREGADTVSFGLDAPPGPNDWGILKIEGRDWLARGAQGICPADELAIAGTHNVANALASLALVGGLDLPTERLVAGLRTFRGLPHRVERITERHGVVWYDDSKGTNVGATLAAIRGIAAGAPGRVLLIAGGEGKGQDFTPLAEPVREHGRAVLLIGRDAPQIEQALTGKAPRIERCDSLEQAVERAAEIAQPGDVVLLSPACASFDMFRDYQHRGEAFAAAVRGLGR